MTLSLSKRFYTVALALTSVLLVFVMIQLVGVVTGTASFDLFARSHMELLALNSIAVVLLLIWVGVYLFRIVGEHRRRIPGTQLAIRILRNIALITFFSMAVVYVFSFLALSRGIDNWFELQVGEAVDEANQLRVLFFDTIELRIRSDLKEMVEELAVLLRERDDQELAAGIGAGAGSGIGAGLQPGSLGLQVQSDGQIFELPSLGDSSSSAELILQDSIRSSIFRLIFDASQSADYEEVTYFEDLNSPEAIVISSSSRTGTLLPVRPSKRLIDQLYLDPVGGQDAADGAIEPDQPWRGRQSSWELLHGDDGSALLRMLIPIPIAGQTQRHYLQVLTTLPSSSQRLAERVSQMNERHERLEYLRNPLKVSFMLALTFVTLVAILLASWAAIGLTRHLVEPIRTLSEGTKAVAEGRYERLDQAATRDDLGVLVESFNDMTRRIKESQEEISQSRLLAEEHSAYLEFVLKHLSSGVMFIDRNERLTNINLATESILQTDAEQVRNAQLRDMISRKQTYSPLFASIAKALKRGASDWSDTVKLETGQGEQILAFSVTELPLPDSASATHVVVMEDITALAQAQRGVAWREVARRMAHEMLNPLQPIQLAVDRIQYKTKANLSEGQSRELELSFAAINRQLNTLHRIVKEFQDYSKPVTLQAAELNLNELIREVIALHEKSERVEKINLELEPDLPEMLGDPDKLVQVFNNLINNAKEAVKDSSRVILEIRSQLNDAGDIVVWVTDNGPGFGSDVLDRIFEPYATTKKQGMGFGLEIVKRIVETHGGSITARNSPDHAGAQIRMEFKVSSALSTAERAAPAHRERRKEA